MTKIHVCRKRVLGLRILGFRVSGLRVLGFRVLESRFWIQWLLFRALGLRLGNVGEAFRAIRLKGLWPKMGPCFHDCSETGGNPKP